MILADTSAWVEFDRATGRPNAANSAFGLQLRAIARDERTTATFP